MGKVDPINLMETNDTVMHVRLLNFEDLSLAALVHINAFHDSALSKLGKEPIRRYYEWQLTGPHDCYAIGAFDDKDELLGFCFSGVFRGALSGFLNKNRKFLFTWIITRPWLVLNPLVTDRIKIALKLQKKVPTPLNTPSKANEKSFGVLSIAVDPDRQGMGIGKLLMDAVEAEAIGRGFQQLHLTVHPSNRQAVAFYERCGWSKVSEEQKAWNGSMRKYL